MRVAAYFRQTLPEERLDRGSSMVHYEGIDAAQNRFQKYDWRLQVVFIGWSISVAVLILGIRLMTTNAGLLSVGP